MNEQTEIQSVVKITATSRRAD